tara:strand:- start:78 stop:1214 length:1137 start_codon:yes stop_codon:yes gene_type:complete
MLRKIFKKIMITTLIIVGILVLGYLAFTNFYPGFGGDVSVDQKLAYKSSPQFQDGKFINKDTSVPQERSFSETMKLAYAFFTTKVPNGRPDHDLVVKKIDSAAAASYKGAARLIWYGHSAFLLQIEGKNILIDPMLGKVAAPHPWLGSNRFNAEFPLAIEKLPQIDAVLFSHDHYDHLDYESVLKLKDKTRHFFVPLGVGAHLKAWGVPSNKITEMDWWQETQFESLKLVCTPAQHFSGRKLNNGQSTLWSSWIIQSKNENIYFSGDSGYAPHFSEIGNKYGPFDIALMECGQYNEQWADIHMMPEETAQAGVDLKADKIMPIHWAGFQLALHSWKDPAERVTKKAKELDLEVITPRIGQEIIINNPTNPYSEWWKRD